MSEELIVSALTSKTEKYEALLPQLSALLSDESDLIANAAIMTAALKEVFNWHWVGFYFVKKEGLLLGPFQGPVACTRISFDKGVCGHAYRHKHTVLVDDVDKFPGHIACSSLSKSEIVVPLIVEDVVKVLLDVDSITIADFNDTDRYYLEKIVCLLLHCFSS